MSLIIQNSTQTTRQKWLFYVASDPKWGGGHMSRSIELAKKMSEDSDVLFVLEKEARWEAHLTGLELDFINEEEWGQSGRVYTGLWSDHYAPDLTFLDKLKQCCSLSCALIDMPEQYQDYDLCVSYADFLSVPHALTGFEYILISPEYARRSLECEVVWDMLITFGQSDSKNASIQVLKALDHYDVSLSIGLVIGRFNKHKAAICEMVTQSKHSIALIEGKNSLAEIYPKAKVYLGAGGTSMLEACAAGLACGVVTTADNQHIQSEALHEQGAVIWISDLKNFNGRRLKEAVDKLCHSSVQEELLSCCERILDVKGSGRLANYLHRLGNVYV